MKNLIIFKLSLLLSTTYGALNTEELRQQAADVTAQAYPDADTVLLNDITHVTYQPDGISQTHTDTAIKILTERGKRNNRTSLSALTYPMVPTTSLMSNASAPKERSFQLILHPIAASWSTHPR